MGNKPNMQRIFFQQLESPANIFSLSKFQITSEPPQRDSFLIVTAKDIYTLRFDSASLRIKCDHLICPSRFLSKDSMFVSQCSFTAKLNGDDKTQVMWSIASTICAKSSAPQQPLSSPDDKVREGDAYLTDSPRNPSKRSKYSSRSDLFRIDFFIDGAESIGNTLNLPFAPLQMEWLTIDASARDESTVTGKKTATHEKYYLVIGGNDYQIHIYQVKFLAKRSDKEDLTAPKVNTIKTIN